MATNEIVTAALLGLVGGITPGPIILLSFSEIVRCPECGLRSGGMYLFFAGLTEFGIGLFLVATAGYLTIPPVVLHGLAIVGVAMLLFIAFRIYTKMKVVSGWLYSSFPGEGGLYSGRKGLPRQSG